MWFKHSFYTDKSSVKFRLLVNSNFKLLKLLNLV